MLLSLPEQLAAVHVGDVAKADFKKFLGFF